MSYGATSKSEWETSEAYEDHGESDVPFRVHSAIGLRVRYAMPGIGVAWGATCPRACYEMPGKGIAHRVIPACAYAMRVTDPAHAELRGLQGQSVAIGLREDCLSH
eukprot:2453186-Rhodomonas_salina.4